MNKKTFFIITLFSLLLTFSTFFTGTTVKAFDEQTPIKESFSCIYNGTERTIIILDNKYKDVFLKIGDGGLMYIGSNILSIGFDKNATLWYIPDYNFVMYINTDLYGTDSLMRYSIFKPTYTPDGSVIFNSCVDDAVSLVFDSENYATGYTNSSGETYPLLTLDEIEAINSPNSTYHPIHTPIPPSTTPTQVPATVEPGQAPTTVEPGQAPETSEVGTSNTSTFSIEKTKTSTSLYKGEEVIGNFKLKSGRLNYTLNNKSGNAKKVKSAGIIKKTKNLIFITKDKKLYTVSYKTDKKKLVGKKVKKLIFKGNYVHKIQKTNGKFVNVNNY